MLISTLNKLSWTIWYSKHSDLSSKTVREISFIFQERIRAPSPTNLVQIKILVHHGYSISAAFTDTTLSLTRTVFKTSSSGPATHGFGHLPFSAIHLGSSRHCSIEDILPPRLGKSAGFIDPGQCLHVMFKRLEMSSITDIRFATHVVQEWAGFCSQCHTVMLSVQACTSKTLMRSSWQMKSAHFAPKKAACNSSLARLIVLSGATFPFEYYRKRGSASYIVREWLLWEGQRERERERRLWRQSISRWNRKWSCIWSPRRRVDPTRRRVLSLSSVHVLDKQLGVWALEQQAMVEWSMNDDGKCKLCVCWWACRGSPSTISLACFKQEE